MNVAYTNDQLRAYLTEAASLSREYPVVITKFIEGATEIELDAVGNEGKVCVCFVFVLKS